MKMLRWLQIAAATAAVALSVGIANADAQDFTIAVVPDTQNYSDITLSQPRGEATFIQQMQYLADQKDQKNIVFVSFVGDLIQHGDGQFRIAPKDGAPGPHTVM
ncbi:hypothetical protein INQ16_30920, partial [Escherichia coli]|nr:hypothetical protein [Escherichia coli]